MEAAAVLLLLELLVVLLLFLGIAGGLAFGLRWIRGKTDWAFDTAQSGLHTGERYLKGGLDSVAKPFITLSGAAETVKGTARALRQEVRATRSATGSVASPAAVPVSRHDVGQIPPPVLDGDTQVVSPPPAGSTGPLLSPGTPGEPSAAHPQASGSRT